jgi:hypothetical protein
MSRIPPIPSQIGIVVGFGFVRALNSKGTEGVLVHWNLTQWTIENDHGKGSHGEGEDQLSGVEQTIW